MSTELNTNHRLVELYHLEGEQTHRIPSFHCEEKVQKCALEMIQVLISQLPKEACNFAQDDVAQVTKDQLVIKNSGRIKKVFDLEEDTAKIYFEWMNNIRNHCFRSCDDSSRQEPPSKEETCQKPSPQSASRVIAELIQSEEKPSHQSAFGMIAELMHSEEKLSATNFSEKECQTEREKPPFASDKECQAQQENVTLSQTAIERLITTNQTLVKHLQKQHQAHLSLMKTPGGSATRVQRRLFCNTPKQVDCVGMCMGSTSSVSPSSSDDEADLPLEATLKQILETAGKTTLSKDDSNQVDNIIQRLNWFIHLQEKLVSYCIKQTTPCHDEELGKYIIELMEAHAQIHEWSDKERRHARYFLQLLDNASMHAVSSQLAEAETKLQQAITKWQSSSSVIPSVQNIVTAVMTYQFYSALYRQQRPAAKASWESPLSSRSHSFSPLRIKHRDEHLDRVRKFLEELKKIACLHE